MSQKLLSLGLILGLSLLSACASLATDKARPIFSDDNGALRGYDPVAYFTEEKAIPGERSITYNYAGHDFYFSTVDNRQRFIDNPDGYLPEYGGYCAYGMSKGFVVSTTPEAFTLVDGKLYLNYSLKVRKNWLKDVPGHIAKADQNWSKKIASKETIEE